MVTPILNPVPPRIRKRSFVKFGWICRRSRLALGKWASTSPTTKSLRRCGPSRAKASRLKASRDWAMSNA